MTITKPPRTQQSVWLPPSTTRSLAGIVIAVGGPLLITPLATSSAGSVFPSVLYVLVVVVAAVVGRLVAGALAIATSVVLLERYLRTSQALAMSRAEEAGALIVFAAVALIVSQLVARLAQAADAAARERSRLRFLADAGDAMAASIDVDATLGALSDVLVPRLADWFAVDLVAGDHIESALVVHPDPKKVELVRELQSRFPSDPTAPTGAPHVIATGSPELIESISDEMLAALVPDADLQSTVRDLRLRCAMVVPLIARGHALGALTLVGAETHERYGPGDLELAEEIADRAALAIDTARLFAAEEQARAAATRQAERNEILKDATAAFGRAATVDDVLRAMLETGARRAGAAAGTVGLIAGDDVDVIGVSGYEMDDHPFWHAFGLGDALPMAEAIRNGEPVVVATTEQRDRLYPLLRGRGEQADHVLVCLPLLLAGTAIGGFSASYPPDTAFDDDDLAFLIGLGEQCAQAIDRARAREGAARTQARFDALASVSRTLALSLNLDITAAAAVVLAEQHLGRRARILELLASGGLITVADSAADEMRTVTGHRPDADLEAAVEAIIAEGTPTALAQSENRGAGAGLVLPLSIASSTFGALLIEEPTIDITDETEVQFATEIARRMARALENGRLYREKAYVARTLQASLLPPALPEIPGMELDAMFLPALHDFEVGGDFYDVFQTEDGAWAAAVGDVCGKGVEAAALTGLARHTLHALADVDAPSEALSQLNRTLLREQLDGRFCTVALARIEPLDEGGARIRLSLGGHPMPLRIAAGDGAATAVGEPGTLLGVTNDVRLKDAEVYLEPGESLLLFTDGILRKSEATGGEPHGPSTIFRGNPPASAFDAREQVRRYVSEHIGDHQYDDIAVLVIRARETAA